MKFHLVFLGPSGAGKTSLMLGLTNTSGVYNFTLDQPRTTRDRRSNETDNEYIFLNQDNFDEQRDNFLFTMKTYGDYEFGLVKQSLLVDQEIRMRILLPANALKFKELVDEPVVFCAVDPINSNDLEKIIKRRDPSIDLVDLKKRTVKITDDISSAHMIADIIYQNVDGIDSSVTKLRKIIEDYASERGE